eukprot:TRINITY_DN11631_c0_g1_i1.p1 TRINITY_DN11631_c0_g1~~TRINITY_DN11631_c0_g1_i1.p1  ORF type:complete len:422 (+),score=87.67 TRINITY_DN11631_c0_g1_i1:155-1420(+)
MGQDLELWLEPLIGHQLPEDFYASVRRDDAKSSSSPTMCSQFEASRLGSVKCSYGSSVMVDVFQKVGTVSVNVLDKHVSKEADVDWPGVPGLRIRVHVIAPEVSLSSILYPQARGAVVPTAPNRSPPSPAMFPSGNLDSLEAELNENLDVPVSPASKSREEIRPTSPLVRMSRTGSLDKMEACKEDGIDIEASLLEANAQVPASPKAPPHHHPFQKLQAAVHAIGAVRRATSADKKARNDEDKHIALHNCDQIVPNLYLGGITAASDTNTLVDLGFKAVCCCCREMEVPDGDFSKELEYYRVDVEDMSREPIELYFPEAIEFIDSYVKQEHPVLVHCRAGVSRSATVVIAYLMQKQGYTLHDAFFLARSHRSIITPNIGFMEKLGDFEEELYGTEPSIEINKYMAWFGMPDRAAVPDLKPD